MLRISSYGASSSDEDDAPKATQSKPTQSKATSSKPATKNKGTNNKRGRGSAPPPAKRTKLGPGPRPAATPFINSAPVVPVGVGVSEELRMISPYTKEVDYNPTYEQMCTPVSGPLALNQKNVSHADANVWTGHVQDAGLSVASFEEERKRFERDGFAEDPTIGTTKLVGDGKAIRRHRQGHKDAPRELKTKESFTKEELGVAPPAGDADADADAAAAIDRSVQSIWAAVDYTRETAKPTAEQAATYADQKTAMEPSTKETKDLLTKEKVVRNAQPTAAVPDPFKVPTTVPGGTNLRSEDPPERCFLPKKHVHTWKGHSKGVSAIRFIPNTAHLLLSASLDCKIKIWEVYNGRRCVQTYHGHSKAVRDIAFNNDGTKFLSTGYDKQIKLWDTETGQVVQRFDNKKVAYCVKFNPQPQKQHLFLAGCNDKKILCYDINSGESVQEYDRHLGPVNSITFCENGTRFATTSDDKSLRVWEWDIPSEMKYIAEPGMYSIATVAKHPNDKWMACQSMDNQITVYGAYGKYGTHRKKNFKGHLVAGYACQPNFSPDGSYLASGDADGKCFIWDWKTCKIFKKFKAHDDVCIDVQWHPRETSKLATAGWDGLIKYWD